MISRLSLAFVLLLIAAAGGAQQPNLQELEKKLLDAAKQREAAQKAQADKQERERRQVLQKSQAEKQDREVAQKPAPLGRLVVTTDADCELKINGERKQALAPVNPAAIEVSVGEQLIECVSTEDPRARVREVRTSAAGSQLVVMLNLAGQVASKRSEAVSAAVPSVSAPAPQNSGVLTTAAGDRIEGDIFSPHGSKGTWLSPSGDRYEGNFVSGVPNGTGIFRYANGMQYQGQFSNGLPNGKGILVWPNNYRYEGEFRDGVPHGKGEFNLANGDRYVGDVVNSLYSGKGTFVFADGTRYEGSFERGVWQGQGTLSSGGSRYEGEFLNGVFHGKGALTLVNGERRVGTFANGKYVSE